MTTDTVDIAAEQVCRAFKSREEIEAAGFVPGWHGEPVAVGDLVVIWGHNGWRQAVVTKVTGEYVHGRFTTPSAIDYAKRIHADSLLIDPLKRRAEEVRFAAKNYDWTAYVAGAQPGDDWSPTDKTFRMKLDARNIAEQQARLAQYGEREAYIEAEGDKVAERARAEYKRASEGGYLQYVNFTNGKGDRTGKRASNLYVTPKGA